MTTTLILGGARSGKSARALQLAPAGAERRIFLATAQALDNEMVERIDHHRAERNDSWVTVEAPLELSEAIKLHDGADTVLLVDCLTLWLFNLMHHGHDVIVETADLITAMQEAAGNIILVSNEIGLGLVPETPLGRDFRDAQGRLNQQIATSCDVVEFIAAGLPIRLKG